MGFALRVGRLDYQSLWYDEGSSVYLARQSLGAITTGAAHDIHPPLYYYLLHWWMAAAGQSEFALRSLSVATGLLIVPLLYVLGRRLWCHQAGLLAAVAGAVSPLLVYYSQETRMYAQVTLFGLLSTYLLVRASEPSAVSRQPAAWLAYGATAAACLYSQYIGALVPAFQGLYVLGVRRKALPGFAVAAAGAVLAFAPWVALAKDSLLGWPSTNAFHAGPWLFGDAALRYVEGLSASFEPLPVGLTVVVVVLGAIGLWKAPAEYRLLAAGYLLVPLAIMFLLGYRKPVYNPKFALLALPGFLLLVGAGVSAMGRLRAAGLALLLASAGYALANYYANPQFARDDYRAVAHFISTSGRPGDAIILDAPGQEQILPYYYRGPLPLIGLPEDRPLNPDKTSAALRRLSGEYKRLWLVLYGTNGSDPDSYVESWLASKDFEIQHQWFGDVRLTAFAAPSSQRPINQPFDATIGSFARLAGYTLTPRPVVSGDVLQLGLRWQAVGRAGDNQKVFTHVIDGEGNIWAQRDSDPSGGARPTGSWQPGDAIEDNYGLLILPGTPPGTYVPEVGMYSPGDGKRLPITAGGQGDRLLLGGIEVGPPAQAPGLDELRIPHPLERTLGGPRLLGYGLTLVGQDAERTSFAAGDEAHLTLFWQADQALTGDRQLSIEAGGQVLTSGTLLPRHATSTWRAGDRYRDQHRLKLPPGDAELVVRMNGEAVGLTRIRVR